jgi:hypothetical protein
LTKEAPYKGPGADSEEKREPVSDIDIAVADSLKVLDLKRPIREATEVLHRREMTRRAMCGRLRVGKENLHVAALVGAAMCSACLRGTQDRWP